jgi:hypothetical protein
MNPILTTSLSLLARPLRAASAHGFCHRCERETDWADHTYAYACTTCGADPVLDAPDEVRATPIEETTRTAARPALRLPGLPALLARIGGRRRALRPAL